MRLRVGFVSDEMKVPVEYKSLDLQVNISNSLQEWQHKEWCKINPLEFRFFFSGL